jgi:hypothetical protein
MLFSIFLLAGCGAIIDSTSPSTSPTNPAEVLTDLASPSSQGSAEVPAIEPTSGDTIDGFKLGVIVACSPGVDLTAAELDRGCAGFPRRATAALDARDPGHPAIVDVATYTDGTQPEPVDYTANAPDPTPAPTAHPGPGVIVFVFTLADRTIRATGVACTRNRSGSSCVGVGAYPTF